MIIGNFKRDAARDTYTGAITTLTAHHADIQLVPVEKPVKKGPAYRLVSKTALGTVEFGSAWKKTSKVGTAYLSVLIDDPSLARGIYAALTMAQESDEAILIWSRSASKKGG